MPDRRHRALEGKGGRMTDVGLVISTEKGMAEVEVSCFEGCHDCSAKSLCIGNKQNKGLLCVKNPIRAHPGDKVKIRIPEDKYHLALIWLFGGFLAAIIFGMGSGYLLGSLLSLRSSFTGPIGLAAGLVFGGIVIARIFRSKNKELLYPVIIDIIKKGECYGSA